MPGCTGGRCIWCRAGTAWWWARRSTNTAATPHPVVSGVRDLLDDACAVLPALGEYELAECAAGLRPMTPDNLPIVRRLDERTLVAAGHGRSGFLLAPWTAEQIVAELAPGRGRGDRLMIVIVNEQEVEVDDQTTVAALLESLGFPAGVSRLRWIRRCCPDRDWTT